MAGDASARGNSAPVTAAFRSLSARIGRDPLMVQGPGGNTSVKEGGILWIKASGTCLAEAEDRDIFVAVDLESARDEAAGGPAALAVDPDCGLRPSIETTFHAMLDWPVVLHTHSVATLAHAIAPGGLEAAARKLDGLDAVFVPFALPGLPLTREIVRSITPASRLLVLANHGLIVCGESPDEAEDLLLETEDRLRLPPRSVDSSAPADVPAEGWVWAEEEGWMARDPRACEIARSGSYYPDHVVFLGPGLPVEPASSRPAALDPGKGALLRADATSAQKAMLRCLSDVLRRLPEDWTPNPIGSVAEERLLDWDAEKHRQAMAERR